MADNLYTHANVEFYVSNSAENSNLTKEQFEALTWIQVKNVGSIPPRGETANELSYATFDSQVALKQKGIADAGSGGLECARADDDPGQQRLREIGSGLDRNNYAFKIVRQDKSIEYHRGLVAGYELSGGSNEDFDLITFNLALNQLMITDSTPAMPVSYTLTPVDALGYYLLVGGVHTAGLAKASTNAQIQTAIRALTSVPGASAVTVSGESGGPFTIAALSGLGNAKIAAIGATIAANYS